MKIFSKSKGDIFVLACCLIYIVVSVCHYIFYSSDFFNLSDQQALRAWMLRIAGSVSMSLAMGAVILFGIRELRRTGFSIRKLMMPMIGIIFCLFNVCAGWALNRLSGDLLFEVFEISDCNIPDLDQSLAMGEIDMETYSKGTFLNAQNSFLKDGSIIEYTMPDGEVVTYEPNEETMQIYKEMHQVKRFFGSLQKSSYWNIYRWSAIATMSVILGFAVPIKKESNED